MTALRLFQLPKSAQYNVLESLSVYETMKLSFCSKKAKIFVKEYGLKASELNVNFRNHLFIETAIPKKKLALCLGFSALLTNTNGVLDRLCDLDFEPKLSFIQLVRHYSYIFNTNEITKCSFSCSDNRYDIESVRRCLKGYTVRILVVGHQLPQNNFQPVLAFGISPKVLILYRNAFQDADVLRKALAHNYDSIVISGHFPEYFSKLDNILAINSAVIKIKGSKFSDKSLNQLLKIWMKTSIPRLRKLQFYFAPNRVIDRNVVLKGIKYTANPPEQNKVMWREAEDGRRRDFVVGGLEITRIDRISATIILEGNNFKFYVWDE